MNKLNDRELTRFLCVNHKKKSGFSLIELLIAVAIIGILTGIAYPSYLDYVLRSNRSEGQRELLRYANLQEQYYIDFRSYASDMKGLGAATATIDTESDNYRISVTAQTATTFTLTATAINNQVKDTNCPTLTINEIGQKNLNISSGCWEK